LIRNTYAQLVQKEPVEYEIYQLVSNGDESKFVILKTCFIKVCLKLVFINVFENLFFKPLKLI